jgi:hypothetical protein
MDNTTNIKEKLREEMERIKKEIESIKTCKDIKKFLDNKEDILLAIDTEEEELHGFSILLTYGEPIIRWDFIRGESKLIGIWGNERIELEVNPEIARDILIYLENEGF